MLRMRTVLVKGALSLLIACGGGAEAPKTAEELAAEKCPEVHLDKVARDWVMVQGATADGKTRLRVVKDGEAYAAYYVGGFFTHTAFEGERRADDLMLTEVPSAQKKEAFDAGEVALTRLFVEPSFKTCAMHVYTGLVDKNGKEAVDPKPLEFLDFGEQGASFSYEPADAPLFLGEAATNRSVADKQVEELGGPKADVPFGTIPVGMWSVVADDGDPSCTYDMDLYFDGVIVEDKKNLPAGEADAEWRHWTHEWSVEFSGNHHFEIYRYRTCADGGRERIGIAGIEAILM